MEFAEQQSFACFSNTPDWRRRRLSSESVDRALATAEAAQRRQFAHRSRNHTRQTGLADAELPLQPRGRLRAMAGQQFFQSFRFGQHAVQYAAKPLNKKSAFQTASYCPKSAFGACRLNDGSEALRHVLDVAAANARHVDAAIARQVDVVLVAQTLDLCGVQRQ